MFSATITDTSGWNAPRRSDATTNYGAKVGSAADNTATLTSGIQT
jgi:hypothetical protein